MELVIPNCKKKTQGRCKIVIQKIHKKTSLQVTFSKRRLGIFKKAAELCVLCGAQIGILVQSPAEKLFAFSHPSLDSLVHRFQNEEGTQLPPPENCAGLREIRVSEGNWIRYAEVWRQLEGEKQMERMMREIPAPESEFWWDRAAEEMELYELEEFALAMEELKANVVRRLEEMKMNVTSSSLCVDVVVENPVQEGGQVYGPNAEGGQKMEDELIGDGEYFGDFPLCSLDYNSFPSYGNYPTVFTSSSL